MKKTCRFGFTLIELLVVIAIIGILVGLISAGLTSAIATGKKTKEMNRLKQVMFAWMMYSGQFDDKLLPGFLEQFPGAANGVQQGPAGTLSWQVHYKNKLGNELAPELCQTYPWRLAPYIDFNYDAFLGYRGDAQESLDKSLYDQPQMNGGLYICNYPPSILPMIPASSSGIDGLGAALQPAFGYNAYYLGGWWEMIDNVPTIKFGNDQSLEPGSTGVTRGRVVSTNIGSIIKPSDTIVFCASIFLNQDNDAYSDFEDYMPGAAWVAPHRLGVQEIWGFGGVILGDIDVQSSIDEATPSDLALAFLSPKPSPKRQGDIGRLLVYQNQAVPFERFGRSVAISVADGSTKTASIKDLNDIRLWAPNAESAAFNHKP